MLAVHELEVRYGRVPAVRGVSLTLAQGEVGKPLTLNLELSTYYRVMANGS